MTINQYFFNYRNTNFVIFARDIPESFEAYSRVLFRDAKPMEDFKNNLLKDAPDIRKCLMLCGRTISRNEAENIRKMYHKPEIIKTEIKMEVAKKRERVETPKDSNPVTGDVNAAPIVKRGRGRPPGSKNKSKMKPEKISNSLDSFFE